MPLLLPPPVPVHVAPPFFGRPSAVDHVASEIYPLRVHYDSAALEARAEAVLGYAELAWAVQVEGLGFPEPVLPDDDIDGPDLDIYLTSTLDAYEAWVWSEDYSDQQTGDGRMGTYGYIAMSANLPSSKVASYTVHEFNHVLHHATDFTETSYNFWEASAAAAQHWTLGDAGYWEEYVPDFQATPWVPAVTGDGYWLYHHEDLWSYFEYGAAFWIMHLDTVLGRGDGASLAALWLAAAQEGDETEPDVVDALVEVSGQPLGDFMNGLARSRWLVGDDWDERGIPGLEGWDASHKVALDGALDQGALPLEYGYAIPPQVLGQSFVTVALDGQSGELSAAVSSERGLGTALIALWWTADDAGEVSDWGEAPSVSVPTEGVERLVLVTTNLGPDGWDGDEDPYRGGDQRLTLSFQAGQGADGGADGAEVDPEGKGCGCSARAWKDAPSPGQALVLLALVGLRRRRGSSASQLAIQAVATRPGEQQRQETRA